MTTIHKYPLNWRYNGVFEIEMPKGSEIISAQMQGDTPTIWAIVNTDMPNVVRRFKGYITGEEIPTKYITHLATFLMVEGRYVEHLFELL